MPLSAQYCSLVCVLFFNSPITGPKMKMMIMIITITNEDDDNDNCNDR